MSITIELNPYRQIQAITASGIRITINQFSIMVTKHMCMEPWTGHPMQQDRTVRAEVAEPDVSGTHPQPY
jgi:hypothetical protein